MQPLAIWPTFGIRVTTPRLELRAMTPELVWSAIENYATLRSFESGSWLGRRFHGLGIGKEMRSALLHLMFDGLGARCATSEAYLDNPQSAGVSRSLGYEHNGRFPVLQRGAPGEVQAFRLDRAAWVRRRRDDITIQGLDDHCLAFLGLAPDPGPTTDGSSTSCSSIVQPVSFRVQQ